MNDEWTKKLVDLLLEIAQAAIDNNKRYFIGGGLAIDLSLGNISREHEDLDFHPEEKDVSWWRRWFTDKGYMLDKTEDMKDTPLAFLLTNENKDFIADIWPINIEHDGKISLLQTDGSHTVWNGKDWRTMKDIVYKGTKTTIEDPNSVLNQKITHARKEGIFLTEKHLHDFKLMNKKVPTDLLKS